MSEQILTSTGTTVRLGEEDGETVVVLANPSAPPDLREAVAGRIVAGHFQAPLFMPFAMSPGVLRAIAELIDGPKPPAPVPYEDHEREVLSVVKERDDLVEVADALAAKIAPPEVLGEHSSTNDPWRNALDYVGRAQFWTATGERHEALRAGVEALAAEGEAWGQGVAVDLSQRLRSLLAETGEVR
jgi:hypothetical protein